MLGTLLLAAEPQVRFSLARLQSLTEWWQILGLLAGSLAIAFYVGWMYRRDSVELSASLAVVLGLLRLTALGGVLFYFLQFERRTERELVKPSRALVVVDTSQSMGMRDGGEGPSGAPVGSGPSRAELVAQELSRTDGSPLARLREKHELVVYRFDEGENPVEVASLPRLPAKDAQSEDASADERFRQTLAESRWLAVVSGGLLLLAAGAGLVHAFFGPRVVSRAQASASGWVGGEKESWSLLAAMVLLIASAIVLAAANLRAPDIGLPAILGLSQPKPPSETVDRAAGQADPDKAADAAVDWLAQLAPRGVETRLGDNLKYLIDKERGGPIAGIVLITDGGQNAGLEYTIAAESARDAMIPVYAIGMGADRRPANLRVVDLEAPERVYPEDKFSLTGFVQGTGLKSTAATVELFSSDADGKNEVREDERAIDLGSAGQITPVKFDLSPKEQGVRLFKLAIKPITGEDVKDNAKFAKVEVVDRKTKVLLVAGGPTRDFIFLRNQLYRGKDSTVHVWLQSATPGSSQEAHEILTKFPSEPDELFEYDCIVGFDPDWEALDEDQTRLLDRFVAEKGGGLIVLAGPVFTPQWSSRRRGDPRIDTLKALYPVAFYFQGSATLSLGRFGSDKPWPLEFTRDGREAEFLWLAEDSAGSERIWSEFEGVYGYYAVRDPKPGAKVYARFSDPDTKLDDELPIYMAGHYYGSGRVFFVASGEMWRVREVDETYFEQFYTKLIRWSAEGRLLRDSSRGVLLVDRDRCLLGDQIAVRAALQDSQFLPLDLPQVQAVVIQPDGSRLTLAMKPVKDAERKGVYAEQFTAVQEGDYRVELQHPAAADQLLVKEVRARIPALETERPERNDKLLRDLADKSGGDYFVGLGPAFDSNTNRPGVVNLLKVQDQVSILSGTPDRKFERTLMGWLMALIVGALCVEWLLRRLNKLA